MVHVADDVGKRLGVIFREWHRGGGGHPEPGPPFDLDASLCQGARQRLRGQQRRRESGPPERAVDDERRERGRFDWDEALFPAGGAADAVVVRLVAAHAAADLTYPGARHLAGNVVEIGARHRRVAEALQHEVAVPRRSLSRADAVQLRVEAVCGSEPDERRPGDG